MFRQVVGKAKLHPGDPRIVAIASDVPLAAALPIVDLNDVPAVADLVYSVAQAMDVVLKALEQYETDGTAL